MQTRTLEKLGITVPLLGFGCMRLPTKEDKTIDQERFQEMIDYALQNGVNYFDTAYPYHEGMSENAVGKALKKHPRDSFYLATKMPMWLVHKEEDLEEYFTAQLKKCQVDYFDFYLLHSLDRGSLKQIEQTKAYDFIKRKQAEGKIKYIGFSFHDTPEELEKIVDKYDFDFVQIQLNYVDWIVQKADEQYDILTKRGIPIIVMEPVRGGFLANLPEESMEVLKSVTDNSPASWAVRYVASLPNAKIVLSGMSNLEQMKDNIETLKDYKPFSAAEREALDKVINQLTTLGSVPCTGCRYCMDCPHGVDIPRNFLIYNDYKRTKSGFGATGNYFKLMPEEARADRCVECGVCVPLCPQHINIPEELKSVHKTMVKLQKEMD